MSFSYRNKKRNSSSEENPYWMSFSDMMSGILIIFILVCSTLVYKLSETKEKINSNIQQLKDDLQVRDNLLLEIKEDLAKNQIFVEIDGDSVVVLESALDFDSGSFAIRGNNIESAKHLGRTLANVLKKDNRWKRLETIFVEGHTDSVSADKRYRMGNWELSALRAISLWKFWTVENFEEFGKDLLDMKHSITVNGIEKTMALFSVSGYADTRRREMNDETEDIRRKNRRINIRLITKQISPSDLEQITNPISSKRK